MSVKQKKNPGHKNGCMTVSDNRYSSLGYFRPILEGELGELIEPGVKA